jgi:hypothetical protein
MRGRSSSILLLLITSCAEPASSSKAPASITARRAPASQLELCQRLAAAPDVRAEHDVLTEREGLPPPMRSIRYGIRRISDGKILASDEYTPGMLSTVEVVLHCQRGGDEHEVVWKPKAAESMETLLRE